VLIEGTYLVRADSPLQKVEDVDHGGVRIAVGAGSAYELFLTRNLKHAQLERRPTGNEAFELFQREGLEAVAGVREVVEGFARRESGLRVLGGRFMAIEQAMGTLKGREAGARYLASFIEEMKASGFVAAALQRSGQTGARVAPSR
jgi:polar amino acid transport system substrate-binding protein